MAMPPMSKWTGGAASATTLGNLAVGSTATQVEELDDKWFLGSDLPSSIVQMSGEPPFSVYVFGGPQSGVRRGWPEHERHQPRLAG